nr:MAG TPA: hypothetical protein [Bacteriophage sp.]
MFILSNVPFYSWVELPFMYTNVLYETDNHCICITIIVYT